MPEYARTRRGNDESESFFCRFTFGQFFALLVLEVFTLFFVFYLGARYGREFLGLNHGPTVAVVEGAGTKAPAVATTDDPEARRLARELIGKAQTPELKERIASMLGEEAPTAAPARTPDVAPSMERPRPAEPAPAPRSEPAATADSREQQRMPFRSPEHAGEETGAGIIRVKSADNARYSIQIGSYQQMAEANQKVDEWKDKGYPSYLMIADIPNRGRWYRVRLGGFATREDASRYLAKLRVSEGIDDALIVLNEQ